MPRKRKNNVAGLSPLAQRIVWLLTNVWGDNAATMAHDLRVTRALISFIARGEQQPGRLLLQRLLSEPRINPEWLRSGAGEPLVKPPEDRSQRLRIAERPLPGPPHLHPEMLSPGDIDLAAVVSPTQYLLELARAEPVLRRAARGFRERDLLLMESHPKRFPGLTALSGDLCVLADRSASPEARLASVTYTWGAGESEEPALLLADTFDAPADVEIGTRYVIDVFTGRNPRLTEFPVRARTGRAGPRELSDLEIDSTPRVIQYANIVAIWTGVLLRRTQLPMP